MAEIEVRLPKMGESVTEATITSWLKEVGEKIEVDEPLVEVATDKVDNELPSEFSGILVKKLFEKDTVAQVGDVIAIINSDSDASISTQNSNIPEEITSISAESEKTNTPKEILELESTTDTKENSIPLPSSSNGKFYSPLVKSIAQKEGLTLNQLEDIDGTGKNGRVTKKDILAYLKVKPADQKTQPTSSLISSTKKPEQVIGSGFFGNIKEPTVTINPGDEIIEMDRMRKLIAEHMVMSTHVAPHVTSYVEADVTNLFNWRNKIKTEFQQKEGEKMTFTPIFIEAVTKAIKDFPMVNVSVSGDKIIKRKDINVGMATALPSGNLIVPVIKNADLLNLTGLTKQVNKLANNARNNKLSPEDIQGGTYTITNVGTFGNVMGTPIINQPQVAILAVGAIRKVPAVIETAEGDFIVIRYKMFLSHSYDHRVVDGALGGQFVRKVADYLEQFDKNRVI
ncbi:MAG: dihydrolipoamide acetyltransferase family protein [Crocinitomicaceae bacterium]|nr:dihydrolipoamide acetyltransferase family protein [Crocinitomicaceae bacterium]